MLFRSAGNQHAQQLTFSNCLYQWNRRHGASGDSINYATWTDCKFNDNGQTINGGATIGDEGATVGGNEYGNGFDMEGYLLGSNVSNLKFVACEFLRNVRDGLLFYDPTNQATVGYATRKNIHLVGCHMDFGTNNINGEYCLTFTCASVNKANGPAYQNISVVGCHLDGMVTLRAADTITFSGNTQSTYTGSYFGVADYATNLKWVANRSEEHTSELQSH